MKLRTLLVSLMLLVGALAPASAQVISQVTPGRTSTTLSTASTGVCLFTTDCNRINLGGYGSVTVQLTGTWTGTVTFEATTTSPGTAEASTTWVAVNLTASNGTAVTTTATANGLFYGTVFGTQFRVRLNPATSGSVVSTIMTTLSSAAANLGNSHSGSFLLADGTAAAPSLGFVSEPALGFRRTGAATVYLSDNSSATAFGVGPAASNAGLSFNGGGSSGVTLASQSTVGWTNGNEQNTRDAYIWHQAAKTLQFDTDGAGGALTLLAVKGPVSYSGKFTTYNGVATAGGGVPAVYASTLTGTVVANTTILTYTPPAVAGRYRIGGVITTTSSTNTGTVQLTVDYVDSQGTTHTADVIPLIDAAGSLAATKTGASKEFHGTDWIISINGAASNIVIKAVITGTVSYTGYAYVEQIS